MGNYKTQCFFTSLKLKQSNIYFNTFESEFEICQNNGKLLEQIQKLHREFTSFITHTAKKPKQNGQKLSGNLKTTMLLMKNRMLY